jgi:hypothetical protein
MAIVGDGVAGGSFLQFVGGESIVTANVGWCVYTSLGDGSTSAPHPTFLLVSGGWVDDEWDGQRRRRVEASKRTSFTQDG